MALLGGRARSILFWLAFLSAALEFLKIPPASVCLAGSTAPADAPGPGPPAETWVEPVTGMEFARVPGGCFQMGCGDWTDNCHANETPVHRVCVGSFWIGRREVTQGQWEKVMGGNPSHFRKGPLYPVENISWHDAVKFARGLSRLGKGKHAFRLPTEAEWEYACRSGGRKEKFSGGGNADPVSWHLHNSGGTTHPVGSKSANGLGLFDMSGNVEEWCGDIYREDAYKRHDLRNPLNTGPRKQPGDRLLKVLGPDHVLRSGNWAGAPEYARCSGRHPGTTAGRGFDVGFRLVRTR